MTEQVSSMERDAFHVSYLSDKIPEAVFHGQAVKTVAYLRVSTAQQDLRRQRLAILEYARKHDFRIDDFIEATASGQASEKRRRVDEPRVPGRGRREPGGGETRPAVAASELGGAGDRGTDPSAVPGASDLRGAAYRPRATPREHRREPVRGV